MMRRRLNFETNDSRRFELEVSMNDTLQEIKAKIERIYGFSTSSQILSHNGDTQLHVDGSQIQLDIPPMLEPYSRRANVVAEVDDWMKEHEKEYVEGYLELEEEDNIEDFGGLAIKEDYDKDYMNDDDEENAPVARKRVLQESRTKKNQQPKLRRGGDLLKTVVM